MLLVCIESLLQYQQRAWFIRAGGPRAKAVFINKCSGTLAASFCVFTAAAARRHPGTLCASQFPCPITMRVLANNPKFKLYWMAIKIGARIHWNRTI